jgi:hypothetical protein
VQQPRKRLAAHARDQRAYRRRKRRGSLLVKFEASVTVLEAMARAGVEPDLKAIAAAAAALLEQWAGGVLRK